MYIVLKTCIIIGILKKLFYTIFSKQLIIFTYDICNIFLLAAPTVMYLTCCANCNVLVKIFLHKYLLFYKYYCNTHDPMLLGRYIWRICLGSRKRFHTLVGLASFGAPLVSPESARTRSASGRLGRLRDLPSYLTTIVNILGQILLPATYPVSSNRPLS